MRISIDCATICKVSLPKSPSVDRPANAAANFTLLDNRQLPYLPREIWAACAGSHRIVQFTQAVQLLYDRPFPIAPRNLILSEERKGKKKQRGKQGRDRIR